MSIPEAESHNSITCEIPRGNVVSFFPHLLFCCLYIRRACCPWLRSEALAVFCTCSGSQSSSGLWIPRTVFRDDLLVLFPDVERCFGNVAVLFLVINPASHKRSRSYSLTAVFCLTSAHFTSSDFISISPLWLFFPSHSYFVCFLLCLFPTLLLF